MKKTLLLFAAFAALALLASCAREDYTPAGSGTAAGHVQTLTATFAPGETKTFFDGSTFKWKNDDAILVRSSNATNGYSEFTNHTGDTAGEVTFVNTSEDVITKGNTSFAYYPAVSGTKIEDNTLKPVLKSNYTWSEGNVQAPMLAKVEDGTPMQFKHLGGVLKVTYKNIPPKAQKLIVKAPVIDADLLAAGKTTYKICQTMNATHNWAADSGFGLETPYLQAYDHSNDYSITVDISSATPAQRASDAGVTVYVPLPVGPNVVAGKNVYPKLNIWLAFADNTVVPGSLRSATNVEIERAHIKPMPAISLTKYSVEVVAGASARGYANGVGTAAKFDQVRGLAWKDNNTLAITESASSVNPTTDRRLRLYNTNTKEVSTPGVICTGTSAWAPWQSAMNGDLLYIANKGAGKIQSFNFSNNSVTDVVTGMNNPMSIVFLGGDAYVCEQAGQALWKFEGGLAGTKSKLFDFSTLDEYSDRAICMKADNAGNLIVGLSINDASSKYYKILVIATDGTKVQEIGEGSKGSSFANLVDGDISHAVFSAGINGMAVDSNGIIYVADNWALRKITHSKADYSDAVVTTIMGNGSSFPNTSSSNLVKFGTLSDVAVDPTDDNVLYIMDFGQYNLSKVTISN